MNIRQKQADVLHRILSLGSPSNADSNYKILILDRYSKDIVAPLLRLNDLRKHGVTLHLMLEAERQPVPDVPAVYLVQPSAATIDRIVLDASSALYSTFHVHFTTPVSSKLLEQLASAAVKSGCFHRIAKVFDQYTAFIALEPSLFSLGLPEVYVTMNDPTARDYQIEATVMSVVEGLFSACVTLGVVPVVRCPRGGAAEHVASLLDQRLRDSLKARHNLFSEGVLGLGASLSRPLLCLFDRNFDLAPTVQHAWTYKPLVQDVLGLRLNKVTLTTEPAPTAGSAAAAAAQTQKRTYDIDDKDFFWEACGSHPFPKVAEEVETQLQRYRAAVDEINKKTAAGAQEGVFDPDELLRKNTQNLMQAVSSLPELQEQKKTLDKHTNLATSLLSAIKARSLDQYYNLEEDLLMGKADLQGLLKLVQGTRGTASDKLRTAVIFLLAADGVPGDSEFMELETALKASGADATAVQYVRTLKRNNLMGASKAGLADAASQNNLLDWADKTFGQGLSQVTKVAKTLLSGTRQPPITAALENLMEGKAGTHEFDSYAIFDPKAPPGRAALERAKGFKEAMVFLIGGGNYLEREMLVSWGARSQPPRQVLYGTTDMLTGDEMLQQLSELARRAGLK